MYVISPLYTPHTIEDMCMLDLAVTVIIVILAWWHREPFSYATSGFALLFYGLCFAGAITDFIVALGPCSFFKALGDGRVGSKAKSAQ